MLCPHKQIWSLGPTLTEVTDAALPQFHLKKSNTTNLDPQWETCLVGHPSCMDMKGLDGSAACVVPLFMTAEQGWVCVPGQEELLYQVRM